MHVIDSHLLSINCIDRSLHQPKKRYLWKKYQSTTLHRHKFTKDTMKFQAKYKK